MKKMICAACGSEDVRRDADAVWNKKTQEWELCAVYDNATCEECGGETRILESIEGAEAQSVTERPNRR